MQRFVSHFTNRLDAKGRVSIPAQYRSILASDGFEGLYTHPSLDAPALDCGGGGFVQEIDDLLQRFPPFSEERDALATALLGTCEILKVDTEGRVILTDPLKAFAGITTEAAFVGQGRKFQIWEPGRFRAHLEEAKARARLMRRRFSESSIALASPIRGARE